MPGPDGEGTPRFSAGAIVVAYSACLALLIPVFLSIGRTTWFEFDDWDYLVNRKAGSLEDLLRPHNGHWEAIPVLVYRALFWAFGLRYVPFELVSIVASFTLAVLLLVVMLRAGTRPWIAVLVATLFVLFGDAQYNVALRVTSITFIGFAAPLGLAQMFLADHKGGLSRRDWFGLALGVTALLCSNVAPVMIFAVGIAMLVKRGWRIALFHTALPFVIFSAWYLIKGRNDIAAGDTGKLRFTGRVIPFAWSLMAGTVESLTRSHGIGALLLILLVAGLALVVWRADPERRRDAVVPLALLAAGAFFAIETGLARADLGERGEAFIRQGHYMAVVALLTLPAVAFLAEEAVRRWRVLTPALVALSLVAIGFNTHALYSRQDAAASFTTEFRDTVEEIPRLSLAQQVPSRTKPFPALATPLTVGWLLDTIRAGRIPKPANATLRIRAIATLHISLVVRAMPFSRCRPLVEPVTVRFAKGAVFRFRGAGVRVGYVQNRRVVGEITMTVPGRSQWALTNQGAPLVLNFASISGDSGRTLRCAPIA